MVSVLRMDSGAVMHPDSFLNFDVNCLFAYLTSFLIYFLTYLLPYLFLPE